MYVTTQQEVRAFRELCWLMPQRELAHSLARTDDFNGPVIGQGTDVKIVISPDQYERQGRMLRKE